MNNFPWTAFYEEVATKLLSHQKNREELINGILKIDKKPRGPGK